MKNLREFGLGMGVFFLILAGLALIHQRLFWIYLLPVSILFILMGILRPGLLKPLQRVWMIFAVVAGFFTTRLILVFLFYGVLGPVGLFMRLFNQDLLDQRISKDKSSYWVKRPPEPKTRKSYENQF